MSEWSVDVAGRRTTLRFENVVVMFVPIELGAEAVAVPIVAGWVASC
jgi:hypothetical protein